MMNTFKNLLGRGLLAGTVLTQLIACSDTNVDLDPKYQPGPLEPYTLEAFAREWAKAEKLNDTEVIVFQDLIARSKGNSDYAGLWEGFARKDFHWPRDERVWSFILNQNLPTCGLDVESSFNNFATALFPTHQYSSSMLMLSLSPNCSAIIETPSLHKTALKLLDEENLTKNETRNLLLSSYLSKIRNHPQRELLLAADNGWRDYFERQLVEFEKTKDEKALLVLQTYDDIESTINKDSLRVGLLSQTSVSDPEPTKEELAQEYADPTLSA